MNHTRRVVVGALLSAGIAAALPGGLAAQDRPLKIAMLLPGRIDDGGFMQAGYDGLLAAERELGAEISHIDGVEPKPETLSAALRKLAAARPDMVIAHGGQTGPAVEAVAREFPDVRFTVIQGAVTGPNVASYEILQEQSAWLAGAAAGLLTKTGVVGHISGLRVRPGLKGRGAFFNGLRYTNPDATYLTSFAGDQDDSALSYRVASAQLEAGADIVFTMLNAAQTGAIKAVRERGARQIGDVRDWYPDHPDVFVASAMADVSLGSLLAVRDLAQGDWQPGFIRKVGLENPDAVALALAPDVPDDVREKIADLAEAIQSGEIEVSVAYDGAEFPF